MKTVIFVVLIEALFSIPVFAQLSSFPNEYCCRLRGPFDWKVVGPVRTVLEVERLNELETEHSCVTTWNNQGQKVERLCHRTGKEIHSGTMVRLDFKIQLIYDAKGKLTEETSQSVEGVPEGKEVYKYSDDGRLFEKTYYHDDGRLFRKKSFVYKTDQRSTEVTETNYDPDRPPTSTTSIFTFNEDERSIKEVVRTRNSLFEWIAVFNFDEKGNLIKETMYDAGGKYQYARLYTYKFDRYGNWIERKERFTKTDKDTGQPTDEGGATWYRVITYYDVK